MIGAGAQRRAVPLAHVRAHTNTQHTHPCKHTHLREVYRLSQHRQRVRQLQVVDQLWGLDLALLQLEVEALGAAHLRTRGQRGSSWPCRVTPARLKLTRKLYTAIHQPGLT